MPISHSLDRRHLRQPRPYAASIPHQNSLWSVTDLGRWQGGPLKCFHRPITEAPVEGKQGCSEALNACYNWAIKERGGGRSMEGTARAYVLGEEEGEAIWFLGTLMVVKAGGSETEGRFALIDQFMPADYATPLHVHHTDDEAFYVLEGELRVHYGQQQLTAGPGTWVFAPKGVPHALQTGAAGARVLTFSSPAGFADFVRSAGEPAREHRLPPPMPVDAQRLTAIAQEHDIEILGPPPQAEG
jgi:mannose-6-phosphate isomerase-like protein (cupin superfamily)